MYAQQKEEDNMFTNARYIYSIKNLISRKIVSPLVSENIFV